MSEKNPNESDPAPQDDGDKPKSDDLDLGRSMPFVFGGGKKKDDAKDEPAPVEDLDATLPSSPDMAPPPAITSLIQVTYSDDIIIPPANEPNLGKSAAAVSWP